jgi:hypothetical protein
MLYILPIIQYSFIVIKNWREVYVNHEFLFCNCPRPSLSSSLFFFFFFSSSSGYCLGLLACSNLELTSEIMNLAYSSSNSVHGASANRNVSPDTGQHRHNDCGHAYMPEWDSNSRSQCVSHLKQYVPLWSAFSHTYIQIVSSAFYLKFKFIYIYKVVQVWPGLIYMYLHINQSRSYLNHLVYIRTASVV